MPPALARKYATVEAEAERLAVNPRTIRRMIARGQLTGYRFGDRLIRLDRELRGHTPAETIAWVSWIADFEDEQVQRRARPVGVILAGDCEPRWLTTVRRWFGR